MPQTNNHMGNALQILGNTGVLDNDVLIETGDISDFDVFTLKSTLGAMDVFVSLDGTNYSANAQALTDLTSTTPATRVVVTTADKTVEFRGTFKRLKVLQNGATAVTAPILLARKLR